MFPFEIRAMLYFSVLTHKNFQRLLLKRNLVNNLKLYLFLALRYQPMRTVIEHNHHMKNHPTPSHLSWLLQCSLCQYYCPLLINDKLKLLCSGTQISPKGSETPFRIITCGSRKYLMLIVVESLEKNPGQNEKRSDRAFYRLEANKKWQVQTGWRRQHDLWVFRFEAVGVVRKKLIALVCLRLQKINEML